ncbi:cell wall-binding repeat-containing protein [Bacillus luteolus]|uniref:Cell wall-binding repeat-containing protein n=1 Tax=Litchfieldia luteola TaxID=682179 RepID=A0ABR9QEM7_9BACI|nr:cell wall-binding repeat-containing protein [Cytobacillus luteolus]MBE4906930.1 cell wall-binding repeat-containing protein [Cytobacillus luteolus]MBP1943607.1 putative cell wall-binding protein [Cytobacillus luteolus]
MRKLVLLLVLLVAMTLAACSSKEEGSQKNENQATNQKESTENNAQSNDIKKESNVYSTKNVTRLDTENIVDTAVQVSKTIWPATHNENKPGAIILAPSENWQIALASANLIHHPNNGPILFYENGELPQQTVDEINRLAPLGISDGTQIFLVVGNMDTNMEDQLKNYKVEKISGKDAPDFAREIDKKYAEVSGEYPKGVIIVSSEEDAKLYSILAGNWISHMPEPILYVTKDEVPQATKSALELRGEGASIYILGPESIISKDIEKQLQEYGDITRIKGKDPITSSIEFAKFKDEKTGFGWGSTEPGHGFSFVSTGNAEYAIAAAPFAHLGKHAPLIWLENGEVAEETHEFLGELQPTFKDDPTTGPYNHGYLIGSEDFITMKVQGALDIMLEIIPESGDGHGGHGGH